MLLKPTEVAARLTVTRGTLYKILDRDPTFPRPVHITPKNPRWHERDIEAWIERKAAA